MNKIAQGFALSCGLFGISANVAHACDLIKDPRPTWEAMIGEVDVVFVGKVVAIVPASTPGNSDRAVFAVDHRVKGEIGTSVKVTQGMNSCMEEFEVGERVLFAGRSVVADGVRITYAESTGWDPTIFLSDPPTPEQAAQLAYLKQITEDRYEALK